MLIDSDIFDKILNLENFILCNSYCYVYVKKELSNNSFNNSNYSLIKRKNITWEINYGENVKLVSYGDGFKIILIGKSMSNAYIGDCLKVLIPSGKIVTGIVKEGFVLKQNCLPQ